MKRYSFKFLVSFVMVMALGACNRYLDVNKTPNNPTSVNPNLLLPNATLSVAWANSNELNRCICTIVQHMAGGTAGTGTTCDSYAIISSTFFNQWESELYGGALTNNYNLINVGNSTGSPVYSGIAKLQLAYTFALVTDIWGDIPYSQALQGTKFLTPRYDRQELIYKGDAASNIQSLFDLVRSGLADLGQASTRNPGSDDVVYGGNIANWRRMGNTLLLKLAMQISVREPALATTIVNEALASSNGFISANNQNYSVPFGASVGAFNPIYSYSYVTAGFRDNLIASTRFINLLTSMGDPRGTVPTTYFATLTSTGAVTNTGPLVGVNNGAAVGGIAVTTWSRYGTYVVGGTPPNGSGSARLITNAMRAFLLAEAVVRLGVAGNANTLYREGITAAMTEAGVSAAAINTFLAGPNGTLTGTTSNQINQIITQKYIANFGNSIEAWNDWRRTGFPALTPSISAAGIDGTIPQRFPVPSTEQQRNPANAPNPGPQTNVRVWWAGGN